ncbi:hypothetical protein [Mycobacterium sp. E1747]|uniref:hypothetical protein n=1 Tax=Mycobacterium sp. E1747 TaxID=1834128 RepID=UPI000AB44113|nr:hypothetical protein [Mycobacterium sp. E1747]
MGPGVTYHWRSVNLSVSEVDDLMCGVRMLLHDEGNARKAVTAAAAVSDGVG